MISPQEPGSTYYYPSAGTTRVSYTHPAVSYTYWRKRIGEEIAAQLDALAGEKPSEAIINASNGFPNYYDGLIVAARLARGEK